MLKKMVYFQEILQVSSKAILASNFLTFASLLYSSAIFIASSACNCNLPMYKFRCVVKINAFINVWLIIHFHSFIKMFWSIALDKKN